MGAVHSQDLCCIFQERQSFRQITKICWQEQFEDGCKSVSLGDAKHVKSNESSCESSCNIIVLSKYQNKGYKRCFNYKLKHFFSTKIKLAVGG